MFPTRIVARSSSVGRRSSIVTSSRRRSTAAAAITDTDEDTDFSKARPFRDIPGPKGLPFIGTLLQYKWGPFSPSRLPEALLSRHRQFGKIFKETIVGRTVVHLFDPDYVRVVYQAEGKIPHIPPLLETTQMYREYRKMSPGLGHTNGDEWYRVRSAVQQMMMRPLAVTAYLPFVNQVANDFLARLDRILRTTTGEVPHLLNEIQKWTFESSAMTCFETRLGAIEADRTSFTQRMINANNAIFSLSMKLQFGLPWYKYFATKTWKEIVKNEDFFFMNGQKLVDETMSKINSLVDKGQLTPDRYHFIGYLMGRDTLSFREVSIITLSLFNDGLKTTSPSIACQLYCIARNPEKQAALYDEISREAPDVHADITSEMVERMSYLKACFKEGFRLFPIGVEVSRIPQKDLVIGNYQIPAGTHVEMNNNMLLRLPEYFPEPEVYRPERWLRGEQTAKVNPYLLLPFGYGPRMCAGRRFAEQEMSVLTIKLLQRYRLEWTSPLDLTQEYEMLLKPHNLMHNMKFVPRT